jgi:hypothetical protein
MRVEKLAVAGNSSATAGTDTVHRTNRKLAIKRRLEFMGFPPCGGTKRIVKEYFSLENADPYANDAAPRPGLSTPAPPPLQ